MTAPSYDIQWDDAVWRFRAMGDWTLSNLDAVDRLLRRDSHRWLGKEITVDVTNVDRLDTAGAMVLYRVLTECGSRTDLSEFVGAVGPKESLLDQARRNAKPCEITRPHRGSFIEMVARVGNGIETFYDQLVEVLAFLGLVMSVLGRTLANPKRLRGTALVKLIEIDGLDAVPIIMLLTFLVGAVVAFLGASILRQFGAEFFVVELIGFAVLREFGVLLTAIIIAGRSGSAFTAQIGAMKTREEVDAMRVIGIDPIEALVIPRVLALMIAAPILTFIADVAGLVGGGLVAWLNLGISPPLFLSRLVDATDLSQFMVGMAKAPFFAFSIAIVGCLQGLEVDGTAESVGRRTTTSVVESIFLVIVLDAFFAMFFLQMGI